LCGVLGSMLSATNININYELSCLELPVPALV